MLHFTGMGIGRTYRILNRPTWQRRSRKDCSKPLAGSRPPNPQFCEQVMRGPAGLKYYADDWFSDHRLLGSGAYHTITSWRSSDHLVELDFLGTNWPEYDRRKKRERQLELKRAARLEPVTRPQMNASCRPCPGALSTGRMSAFGGKADVGRQNCREPMIEASPRRSRAGKSAISVNSRR